MTELLDGVKLPGTLLVAVLIFGFVPGFVLRIAVLLYPRNDERRRELLAELYAMPRIVRPFWVAEQFETALFEGARERLKARKKRREKKCAPEEVLVAEQGAGDLEARERFLKHAAEVTMLAAVFEPVEHFDVDERPAGTHGFTTAVFGAGAPEGARDPRAAEDLARRIEEFYSA
ncbi:hypothetical protein AB0L41_29465 [Amycolatopsis mediterranei]|uniref:hypothetical protein n=1 Tax=Amycolatopsis mediterranei TaxID=33910 RepID=UPI003440BE4B